MRALITRDVVVLAGFLGIAGQRFGIQGLAHLQRFVHQKLRGSNLVVIPIESHAQQGAAVSISISRIQIQVIGPIRHASALHLVIKRMPKRVLHAFLPGTTPVGHARRRGDAADGARARLTGPNHAAADEAGLRIVQLIAVQIIERGAAAADADEGIGLHAFIEEQGDAI